MTLIDEAVELTQRQSSAHAHHRLQLWRPRRDRRRPARSPTGFRRYAETGGHHVGALSGALDTAGIPDPDLLVRTSGEMRISNFLLWQCAYTEFVFLDTYWPDFGAELLEAAIAGYRARAPLRRPQAVDHVSAARW